MHVQLTRPADISPHPRRSEWIRLSKWIGSGSAIRLVVVLAMICGFAGAGRVLAANAQATPESPPLPPAEVDATMFEAGVANPYFPLVPGTTSVYEGMSEDGPELVEVTVTFDTKTILGVVCTVVRDTVSVDGELVEDTYDWFAQDNAGNVWYFGEASADYEDGEVVSTDGSWEAGVDGAVPGIVMPADAVVGDPYYQEYAPGEAEDIGQIIAVDQTIAVTYGTFTDVIVTEDTNPLEPGPVEHKSFAPGVGLVLEEKVAGDEGRVELVEIRQGTEATPESGLNGL